MMYFKPNGYEKIDSTKFFNDVYFSINKCAKNRIWN
jgi:hypothetical protein